MAYQPNKKEEQPKKALTEELTPEQIEDQKLYADESDDDFDEILELEW